MEAAEFAEHLVVDDIRDIFPMLSVKIENTTALDDSLETAMIQDKSGLRTPFTLDGLAARYGLKISSLPPVATRATDETDLVILYRRTELPELSTLGDSGVPMGDQDFQEPLAPQKNPFTR